MPRAPPGRTKSFDSSTPGRGRAPPGRNKSFDAGTLGRGRAPPARSRSMDPVPRGRSLDPAPRGRSKDPAPRGRPSTSGARSVSPSRIVSSGSPGGGPQGEPQKKRRGAPRRGIRKIKKGMKRMAPRRREKSGENKRQVYKRQGKFASVRNMSMSENCTKKKVICYVCASLMFLVSIGGLVVSTGNTPNAIKKLIPSLPWEEVDDPFAGGRGNGGPGDKGWKSDGNGLDVTIVNAVSDLWQITLALAVADWDFGNPDALSLRTEQVPHEVECTPVEGKIKICSGDYGDSKWRGINQVAVDGTGYIVGSVARVNEYYLLHADDSARQYTVCHELGHAFGLFHTDEEFGNPDLGNCLDYTENFDYNKHPDETLYDQLAQLYGVVGDSTGGDDAAEGGDVAEEGDIAEGGAGARRLRVAQTFFRQTPMPSHIQRKMKEVVSKLEQRKDDNAHEDGWELLHRTKYGEAHEMDLGEGFVVRVQMLLA